MLLFTFTCIYMYVISFLYSSDVSGGKVPYHLLLYYLCGGKTLIFIYTLQTVVHDLMHAINHTKYFSLFALWMLFSYSSTHCCMASVGMTFSFRR